MLSRFFAKSRTAKFVLTLLVFLCGAAGFGFADASDPSRGEARARIEPAGFIYGGAIGVRREIYSNYDRRVVPMPIIGYRGERLRVFGPFVTYDLYRSGALGVDARLSPRFQGFDESNSDIFRGMDERDSSLDLGLGLTFERDEWKLEFIALRDVLDRSNGRELRVGLGRAFRAGSLVVEPVVGLSYLDRAHVDYYYGVAASESTTFRPAYAGDSALNARFGLNFVTLAYFGGLTRLGLERTWFDSSIDGSPLTDEDADFGVFIAFSKFFDK